MTNLSPKAMRFVDMAMREMGSREREVWANLDRASTELSAEAEEVVLAALARYETTVRARLAAARSDDEISDLSNDLGFIAAIGRDLAGAQSRRSRRRIRQTAS